MYVYIYVYMYIYIYIYICMCVCMYFICIIFIGGNFIHSVLNVLTFYTHKRYFVCVVQIISV